MNGKPQSMRGNGFDGRGGRAPGGRGLHKPLGRNAQGNRNLPPPPGTRGKSQRNLRPNSSHKLARNQSPESDSDDDNDEFAADLADDERRGFIRGGAPTSSRVNADGTISMSRSSHSTAFSIDEDEDYADEEEFASAEPMVISRMPSSHQTKQKVQRPGLGLNDSDHSLRGWTQSFRWGGGDRGATMDTSKSVRSLLSVDMEHEVEPAWKQWLRYIRILAPHPDEKPLKRNIRIFTWLALTLDFLTALVSITTYTDVAYCCGDAVLSIAGDIDWHLAIQVTVYLYMALIFVEILPVMREGFPFHLVNPFIGFLVTFGMFFDDRILAAVIMWIIEATAVSCEFYVYRLKVRWHNQRQERLEKAESDITALKKERRRRKLSASGHDDNSASSASSLEDGSFHDESYNSANKEARRPKDVTQIRETRLLRERRLLRQAQSEDTRHLRYHFIGVSFNIGLVVISLLMISMVGRSGGLCIVDMIPPNIFKTGQLEKCFECKGVEGACEICRDDGTSFCYFPYY
jgi:hypothetical protein